MAIIEIGINYGLKSLVDLKYYNNSDKVLDSKIRAKFLAGVQDYISEVYHDKMNVISFSNFQIACYCKKIQVPDNDSPDSPLLIAFAIIEKDTDQNLVKSHLKLIISEFLKMFHLDEIISKSLNHFKPFEIQINKILGDLRFKIEDRIGKLFK
ncbi:MAG: hypothetical protein JSV62_06235 [Promethearchaeota archaeon]|nr:MAG: hypothetical protein JSV62_06235 [Candidatus Lokiarchaeota archaeon]